MYSGEFYQISLPFDVEQSDSNSGTDRRSHGAGFCAKKGTEAMEINREPPDKCSWRGIRLTNNLYECRACQTACRYKFYFGNGYYCSTLVPEHGEQPGYHAL